MTIEGLIAQRDENATEIIGFTGVNLECEGCEDKVSELYETADSVKLCKGCYDSCVEDNAQLNQ